jgi:hypothetical protein
MLHLVKYHQNDPTYRRRHHNQYLLSHCCPPSLLSTRAVISIDTECYKNKMKFL